MKREYGDPEIDSGRCYGCGMCVALCPENVLAMRRAGRKMEVILIENGGCTGCGTCVFICPGRAITVEACGLMPLF